MTGQLQKSGYYSKHRTQPMSKHHNKCIKCFLWRDKVLIMNEFTEAKAIEDVMNNAEDYLTVHG